jgi:hypothetical protein
MSLKIGFSTGCLHASLANNISMIHAIEKTGCRAIELSFLRLNDFTSGNIGALPIDKLLSFEYLSLHAPIHEYGDDAITYRIFEEMKKLYLKLNFDLAVFHPDTVVDFSVFYNLDFPVGFENMDNRKTRFKTPRELAVLVKTTPSFKFVLDLNHVCSNDPTMELTAGFYDQLSPRLTQIHLSGYNGHHVPLFMTEQTEMVDAIQHFDTPIIIESVLPPGDLVKELKYVEKQILISGRI